MQALGLLDGTPRWTLFVLPVALVLMLPMATILVLAAGGEGAQWRHLIANVLPRASRETALLLAGAGTLTLVVGTSTAWIVTMYRFPGRAVIDRLLVIPLAIPTYLAAYCYVEILDHTGPVQTALRWLAGMHSGRLTWFPEVRSIGGGVFVISAVLYPYVYLAARASFVQQSICALEVARTLGRTETGAFLEVALPMARPALAAGVALALMECLNDLGAVQYLGIETLTVSVYSTWLQRSSLPSAAQIAIVILAFAAILFAIERAARGRARFHHTTGRYRAIPFAEITGLRGVAIAGLCALPFVIGFALPAGVLVSGAWSYGRDALAAGFLGSLLNSLTLAAVTALVAVAAALLIAYARRVADNPTTRLAAQVTGLGYAIPGTVLALGLLLPLAAVDNAVDAALRATTGLTSGLLLSGTLFAIVLALTIRFLAVSLGSVSAGLERISPNLDAASRTLGETAAGTLWRVHLPLLVPSIGAAALLVFVDTMKELPATLLLRPFNFETLATQVYALASLEQFEQASAGALAIVAAGLVPVLLLHQAVAGGRPGRRARVPRPLDAERHRA
ncbi:MAG: iron ABC transporter permease [Hyphomicrobiaceae bacterium]